MPMNENRQSISLAGATDGSYAMPLAVMLSSVGQHAGPSVDIRAYILDDGVPEPDKARVIASLPANVRLIWCHPDTALEGLPTWGRMPLTTYRKLTVGEWLPQDLHRVIWLDCDLLVLEDISGLWRNEIGESIALAVADPRVRSVSSRFGVAAWRELKLPPQSTYFNAGVMLIDLKRWREQQVGPRTLDYIRTCGDRVYFWDQEALNAVLAGAWGELNSRWNQHPSLGQVATVGRQYGDRPIGSDGIAHFSGRLKPWNYAGGGEMQALYQRYLARTAWAGQNPPNSWQQRALGWYEYSRFRRLLYPVERWLMIAEKSLTQR